MKNRKTNVSIEFNRIMKENGYSQSSFAKKLKISNGFISLILNSKINPSFKSVIRYSKILKCDNKKLIEARINDLLIKNKCNFIAKLR